MIFMTQRKLKLPRRCSPPAGRTRGSVPDSLCCCHFMLQSVVKTNGYMKRSVNRGSTEDAEDEVHQYREQNPEQEPQERDIENSQTRRSRARSRSSRSSRGAPHVDRQDEDQHSEDAECGAECSRTQATGSQKGPSKQQHQDQAHQTITIAHAMCERPCAFQRRL